MEQTAWMGSWEIYSIYRRISACKGSALATYAVSLSWKPRLSEMGQKEREINAGKETLSQWVIEQNMGSVTNHGELRYYLFTYYPLSLLN